MSFKNYQKFCKIAVSSLVCLAMISCSYKPVLYQNKKFYNTDKEQRENDIENCVETAENQLRQDKLKHVAKESARSAILWGAIVGVLFFVIGGNSRSLFTGLAVGAGTGALVGGASAAAQGTLTPDQIKQGYANRCLAEKGYDVVGWR